MNGIFNIIKNYLSNFQIKLQKIKNRYKQANLNSFIKFKSFLFFLLISAFLLGVLKESEKDHFTLSVREENQDYFFATPNHLLSQADQYFQKKHIQNLRPVAFNLPHPERMSEQEILDQLLNQYQGFCIGEYHSDYAPKDFLIDHMSYLKEKGVKVLFMEQFYDHLQQDLDDYFNGLPLSPRLMQNVTNASFSYGYLEIVKAARDHQIRVIAIDTESANINDLPKRWKAMNYFAYLIMKPILQEFDEQDKYIAFMGAGHLSRRQGTILGIAELFQCPRLAVIDHSRMKDTYDLNASNAKVFNLSHLPGDKEIKVDLVILK